MAAGKGTRLNATDKPKVMFEILGKPMIDYAVKPLLEMKEQGKLDEIVVVVGFLAQQIEDYLGDKVKYVLQSEQLGTAHAVLQARELLEGKAGTTLIINGDHTLYTSGTFDKLMSFREDQNLTIAFGAAISKEKFDDYGRIIRDENGNIQKITEKLDCTDDERKIEERNPNLYAIDNEWLWSAISKISNQNAKNEYYLTDIIKIALDEGKKIETVKIEDDDEALGINNLEDLQKIQNILESRKA